MKILPNASNLEELMQRDDLNLKQNAIPHQIHSLILKIDDRHPKHRSISKKEAKARVTQAVEEYRSGKMKTVPYSQGMDEIDNWLNSL